MQISEGQLSRGSFDSSEFYRQLLIPDLRKVGELRLDRFMFLGAHAVIHTIEGILFDRHGPAATKSYLSSYVDGQEENTMFSLVADTIHELRNDLAHQWISTHAYRYIIDYRRELGWWEDTEGVHINPDRYFEQFIASWEGDGAIWNCHSAMSERDLELMRYRFLLKWLNVPKEDPIMSAFKAMKSASTDPAFGSAVTRCRTAIEVKYCV